VSELVGFERREGTFFAARTRIEVVANGQARECSFEVADPHMRPGGEMYQCGWIRREVNVSCACDGPLSESGGGRPAWVAVEL